MFNLPGKISDRIRSGDIPADSLTTRRIESADETPTTEAIRAAEGHGIGHGATRARNGGAS